MKKFILLLIIGGINHLSAKSQVQATEGKIEFQKGDKAAAVIELPYPAGLIEDAIKDYFSKKGIKQEKNKGFQVFQGAKLSEYDTELTDLYFKVDRKSRREKDASVVYLIVGRPSETLGSRTADDRYRIDEGKKLLEDLVSHIEAHHLEVGIGDQEGAIKKAEKKLKNLEDDQKDLEDRIRKLQDKLEEVKKDQIKQSDEINKQRSIRDAMLERRKN